MDPTNGADARAARIEPGDTLAGRYSIERFLARGGMGEVFRAFDRELEIPVVPAGRDAATC